MGNTVKDFLDDVRQTRRRADDLKAEVAMIESDMDFLRSSGVGGLGIQNNSQKDISDCLIRLEDRRERAIRAIKEVTLIREAAERLIEAIDSESCKSVLIRRYILGEPWETVAENVNYDRSTVFRLNNKAIRQIEKSEGWKDFKKKSDGKGATRRKRSRTYKEG